MMKPTLTLLLILLALATRVLAAPAVRSDMHANRYFPNRPPLAAKPYLELPLGAIEAHGWLRHQLESMARGMTGHLDELYPQVLGPRNGWLGGDGDGWERGPYWIDGLVPLGHILKDETLLAKAHRWIEWTLTHQAEDGYIGPVPFETPPKQEPGLQRGRRRDWWPKMVMLKVLQQHFMATGDERVIGVLTRYFRYQLKELPKTPLGHWSFWGNRRGGDNLLVVYWLYNVTGDKFLLELGDLIARQTHPYTEVFLERGDISLQRYQKGLPNAVPFHCVNLAQGIKQPIVRYQAHPDEKYLRAVKKGFADLEKFHGQANGMYGGDEGLHGRMPTQGSEFCSCIELMFSLEKMLEITGDVEFADRLEKIAFNVLPTQTTDDFQTRQYFQQVNQVACTYSIHNFFDHTNDGVVYGLLTGYPCCTCNLHQGWPKLTQHLWLGTADHGLAALVYAPSQVTAKVANGKQVSIIEETDYPFGSTIRFKFKTESEVAFPFSLRIPGWCQLATVMVNGRAHGESPGGQIIRIHRTWKDGDLVELQLPMRLVSRRWHENSVSLERGPLVFALRIAEEWKSVGESNSQSAYREIRPASPWNFALIESSLTDLDKEYRVERSDNIALQPWNLENAPISLKARGIRLPEWKLYHEMAGPLPWSPQPRQDNTAPEEIVLVPYGCTTLRIAAFPTVR